MQTPETIEIGGAAETRTGGSCIVSGFTCTDPRPVSHRRSAFFAALARRSGETADRIVAVELGWRIPSAEVSLEAQQ